MIRELGQACRWWSNFYLHALGALIAYNLLFCGEARAQRFPVSEPELRPFIEQRYCGVPERDADGNIHRSGAVLYAFQKIHPCPVNGKDKGVCPGWAIDHVIPLACGGCDAVSNLQWLPLDLKAGKRGKDRFERLIYCSPAKQVVR